MKATSVAALALAAILATAAAGCSSSQAGSSAGGSTGGGGGQSAAAQLGQQIFTTGNGTDGAPIATTSGAGGPCARCHGDDAKGKVGPDIRWSVLTGATTSSHPPRFTISDESQFATIVTTGEANGNQLRQMMPHYQMSAAQIAGLVAYLKTL